MVRCPPCGPSEGGFMTNNEDDGCYWAPSLYMCEIWSNHKFHKETRATVERKEVVREKESLFRKTQLQPMKLEYLRLTMTNLTCVSKCPTLSYLLLHPPLLKSLWWAPDLDLTKTTQLLKPEAFWRALQSKNWCHTCSQWKPTLKGI